VTDGNGYLFVVGIEKGNLIKAIPLPNPGSTNYNANPVGFTQIQTMALSGPDTDKTGLGWLVYGGDLNGNVWRFDISAKDKENWTVRKFASKVSTDGTGRPITTAPALGYIKTPFAGNPVDNRYSDLDNKEKRLMVYVGTGKLLEPTDIDKAADKNTKHGFFAMEDYAATLSNLSATDPENSFIYGETPCAPFGNCLVLVGLPNGNATDPNGLNNWMAESEVDTLRDWWIRYKYGEFNYGGKLHVKRGWFIEFSDKGSERVISDPVFGGTFVTFNTTMITDWRHGAAGRCENAYSAQFVLGSGKGGTLPASKFKDGTAWSRMNLGFGIASSGTLFVGTDGFYRNITNTGGDVKTTVMPEQDPVDKNSGQLRRWGWREIYR
jgi:Tfp pilus tip-associated adhesin PilY1